MRSVTVSCGPNLNPSGATSKYTLETKGKTWIDGWGYYPAMNLRSGFIQGVQALCEQFRQAGSLREGRHGHQAAMRHEIRVI